MYGMKTRPVQSVVADIVLPREFLANRFHGRRHPIPFLEVDHTATGFLASELIVFSSIRMREPIGMK